MIPTVDELASSPMRHRTGELFNPPALTNFLGVVQADVDPVAIRCQSFPPFASGWTATGGLFLNRRLFASTGGRTTFRWFPDRIEREAAWDGWRVRTTTALVRGEMAALVRIEIRNEGPSRELEVRLGLRAEVTQQTDAWRAPYPPSEQDNQARLAPDGVAFCSRGSDAVWVQAGWPSPASVEPNAITWRAHAPSGSTTELRFASVMGQQEAAARALGDRLLQTLPEQLAATHREWTEELAAIFTPGNDRYGGSLPVLETDDEDLRRIYNLGAVGVAYFKRQSPVLGRTYDTLMPAFWQTATFLWDYSLSGVVHALLDPGVMRRHLEHWMSTDVHTCFGTEWLTGSPMGAWYSVNDFAMTRMMNDYLRWNGDTAWLGQRAGEVTVHDHLRRFATNWERFRTPNGLADYGGINNLLECVSTYVHEIAALNAGNVFNLRVAAGVEPDRARAEAMRAQADELVAQIQKLYAGGQGYWNTRLPDGSLVAVRHCYDFITVMATIGEDLSPSQREEMAAFCLREFRTPTWMRALSVNDPDASFSVRPDHQWNGAYPAWPPGALAGLWRAGRVDDGVAWLRDIARSANQGPFGQAHFVEEYAELEEGGARKATPEFPYINDWTCSSNGSWVALVIESIFGVRASVDGITAQPAFGSLDPDARLRGLRFHGELYDVDAKGIHRA